MPINRTLNNLKSYGISLERPCHVIRDCRKRMKKEQEQRHDLSFQNTKFSISIAFALCPHCQRTNHPPLKCWSGPNAVNRPKRLKQDQPADSLKNGPEQGNRPIKDPN